MATKNHSAAFASKKGIAHSESVRRQIPEATAEEIEYALVAIEVPSNDFDAAPEKIDSRFPEMVRLSEPRGIAQIVLGMMLACALHAARF
jgi:hypothetical protein